MTSLVSTAAVASRLTDWYSSAVCWWRPVYLVTVDALLQQSHLLLLLLPLPHRLGTPGFLSFDSPVGTSWHFRWLLLRVKKKMLRNIPANRAQHFRVLDIFCPYIPHVWIFSPKFCIFGRQFSDKKKIFRHEENVLTSLNLGGGEGVIALPAPCHDAIGCVSLLVRYTQYSAIFVWYLLLRCPSICLAGQLGF